MKLDFRVLGSVGTNCYLLINEATNEGVLIDPADSFERIVQMIELNNCKLKAVLLTHGHYDHIYAAQEVRDKYGVDIYASCDEEALLKDAALNLSASTGRRVTLEADYYHRDGEILSLAGMDIRVIHTPGHTSGGTCYYISEAGSLFSGDTLFAQSVGRTDFPTGSMSLIVRSIKEKLFVLPDETKVFPGHGEGTSIAYEKKYNPFVS